MGELIDKLTVIHLKIWHIEEEIEKGGDDAKIEKLCDQVVNLNSARDEIIKAIDAYFKEK
jgi:hypothetical protein